MSNNKIKSGDGYAKKGMDTQTQQWRINAG